MSPVETLVCTRCGAEWDPDAVSYTCPRHDGDDGILDVRYDHDDVWQFDRSAAAEAATRPSADSTADSMWRYGDRLPVASSPVTLGEGATALLDAPALSERLGVEALVKDETANPTGSSKDRGTAVAVTRAVAAGHDVVTCASTGNAAASLAGYAARAGLDCSIFVPRGVPGGKAVQPSTYGATVFAVDGSYADAYECCRAVARDRGWYNRSAALNPYAMEGYRTLGFELAEEVPDADWVAMPMGNGCSLAGVWKGFAEFDRLDHLDDPPRMLGVQATGAALIHDAFHEGGAGETDPRDSGTGGTVADSIDVSVPHNAEKARRALSASGGTAVAVDDDAIMAGQRLLAESEGLFVEPASAAAVAGVRAGLERGAVDPTDRVVVVATGSGLKDADAAREHRDAHVHVGPDPESVPEEW